MEEKETVKFGEGGYFSLNRKIKRKLIPNKEFYGLFAEESIKEGEICWRDVKTDNRDDFDIPDAEKLPKEEQEYRFQYSYQIAPDRMRGVKDVEKDYSVYCNHSCDPNNWYEGEGLFTAIRDIQAGEEITYDYATSETYDTTIEKCLCGAKNCRTYVTCNDWKIPEIREKYKGHFAPFIQKMIEEEK
eukprot:gene5128-8726_t